MGRAASKPAEADAPAPAEDTPAPVPAEDTPAPPAPVMSAADRKALVRQQAQDAGPPRDPKANFNLAEGSEWYPVPGTQADVALTITDQGHYYVTMCGSGRTRSIPLIALTVLEDKNLV